MNYHGSPWYSMVVHGHVAIIFAWAASVMLGQSGTWASLPEAGYQDFVQISFVWAHFVAFNRHATNLDVALGRFSGPFTIETCYAKSSQKLTGFSLNFMLWFY